MYSTGWGKNEGEHYQLGVGLAIKSELAKSLQSLTRGISDRMTLNLSLSNNKSAALISCYTPTMNASQHEVDNFYDQLQSFQKSASVINYSLWATLILE